VDELKTQATARLREMLLSNPGASPDYAEQTILWPLLRKHGSSEGGEDVWKWFEDEHRRLSEDAARS
jgi:hypothetical protein